MFCLKFEYEGISKVDVTILVHRAAPDPDFGDPAGYGSRILDPAGSGTSLLLQ